MRSWIMLLKRLHSYVLTRHPRLVVTTTDTTVFQSARSSWKRTVTAWVYVPIGLVAVMAICFGVHSLISISSVSFPASVACMIGLFFLLILSQSVLGDKKTKRLVALIEIPVSILNLLQFPLSHCDHSADLLCATSISSSVLLSYRYL